MSPGTKDISHDRRSHKNDGAVRQTEPWDKGKMEYTDNIQTNEARSQKKEDIKDIVDIKDI